MTHETNTDPARREKMEEENNVIKSGKYTQFGVKILRSKTNTGDFAKQKFIIFQALGHNISLIVYKLVLSSNFALYYDYYPIKKYKEKILFLQVYSIKLSTLDSVLQWIGFLNIPYEFIFTAPLHAEITRLKAIIQKSEDMIPGDDEKMESFRKIAQKGGVVLHTATGRLTTGIDSPIETNE